MMKLWWNIDRFFFVVLIIVSSSTTTTNAFSSSSTSCPISTTRNKQPSSSLLLRIRHKQQPRSIILQQGRQKRRRSIPSSSSWTSSPAHSSSSSSRQQGTNIVNGGEGTTINAKQSFLQNLALLVAGLASTICWIILSIVALRYHPDPKFAFCSRKHNILTMSQAFAFPIPILLASIFGASTEQDSISTSTRRRLQLGLAITFAYNFVSLSVCAPTFACGYDLFSHKLKAITGTIFGFSSLLYWISWKETSGRRNIIQSINEGLWSIAPKKTSASSSAAPMFATATIGFLWFTIQPIVSKYPLMTIPTILGKRLSRAASAYTLLGAIISYCLKEQAEDNSSQKSSRSQRNLLLKRGLMIGSGLHLLLVLLKLIGIDDGGLLLPGNGLWEVYPAMMAVPFATACSLWVHFVAFWGTITM